MSRDRRIAGGGEQLNFSSGCTALGHAIAQENVAGKAARLCGGFWLFLAWVPAILGVGVGFFGFAFLCFFFSHALTTCFGITLMMTGRVDGTELSRVSALHLRGLI
jgi:hypothetical protein